MTSQFFLATCRKIITRNLVVWLACGVASAVVMGQAAREPKMTWLDNGVVRVGMDLNLGGAVTHISTRNHPGNIINSFDLGRQIQMSHYSGPNPFTVGDKKPAPAWAGLGWNPIQTGDCYNNPSVVVDHRNDGQSIFIQCIPMQWPLNNVPGDCLFETWTTLDGPCIFMRYRVTNKRQDTTLYAARAQELPAVYTISKLWRLLSYTGEKPFTQDALTHVKNDWHKSWPWTQFIGTERWAALVGDDDWGLGVFKDDGAVFHGGIHGDGRSDDPKHASTAYVAPIHFETLDPNIVYEHRTVFMAGKLDEIRQRFNAMATRTPPAWRFKQDRQHWHVQNGNDAGWPMKDGWRVQFDERKARLIGPTLPWRAHDAPTLELEVACQGRSPTARICWSRLDDPKLDPAKSLTLDLNPDGAFHRYRLDLSASPEYRGLILQLVLELAGQTRASETITVRSLVLSASKPDRDARK